MDCRLHEGRRLSDGREFDARISLPMRLADAEIARDFIAQAGAFRAAIFSGGFQIRRGSGDDSKLFRRDESAFDADRSKANISSALLRARHAGTPGSRA